MKRVLLILALLLAFTTTHAQTGSTPADAIIVNKQTGTTYTVQSVDRGRLVTFTNGSAIAVALPRFSTGWYAWFENRGVGTVTITPASGFINTSGTLSIALTTGQGFFLSSDGTNYFTGARGTGAGGGGTVTTVSVTTANGISGTVATATTTPAITLDISGLNAAKIGGGGVSTTEYDFLGSVTSDIQAQLNAKQATITLLPLANGGTHTNLSATGGANQVVMQESVGGDFTVRALANADLPGTISSKTVDNTNAISLKSVASIATCTKYQLLGFNTGDQPYFCSAANTPVQLWNASVNTSLAEINSSCVDAGSNDTYACTLNPAIAAYAVGSRLRFYPATANTGAATINFNSLGALTLVKVAGGITTALADNDIRVGQWVECVVAAGSNCQVVSGLGNSASSTPGGSDTQVQFNDSSAFGGDAGLTYNKTTDTLTGVAAVFAPVNTTGNGVSITSATVTTGNLVSIVASGTAAASSTKTALNVAISGANATSTQATYGAQFNNTSTGTSSTNVGAVFSASGATTNYAIQLNGNVNLPGGTVFLVNGTQFLNLSVAGIVQVNPNSSSGVDFQVKSTNNANFIKAANSATIGNETLTFGGTPTPSATAPFVQVQSQLAGRIGFAVDGFTSQTADVFQVRDVSTNILYKVGATGIVGIQGTDTAGGTTGAQTINKPSGTVNFAATATSLVVTNSLATTTTYIQCTIQTNDTTMKSVQCVPASGSFTIYANAAATAETKVYWAIHAIQ